MTALWRYKDTESVVKAMDGYTPGEGWMLYVPAQTAPAWHYAPTVPGLWMCQQAYTGNMQAFEVTDPVALAMNLEIEGRWYGPIPMEDQT